MCVDLDVDRRTGPCTNRCVRSPGGSSLTCRDVTSFVSVTYSVTRVFCPGARSPAYGHVNSINHIANNNTDTNTNNITTTTNNNNNNYANVVTNRNRLFVVMNKIHFLLSLAKSIITIINSNMSDNGSYRSIGNTDSCNSRISSQTNDSRVKTARNNTNVKLPSSSHHHH